MSDDELLWSVTTILKAGTPRGDALVGWAARVTAEAAIEFRAAVNTMMEQDPPQEAEAIDMIKKARFRKSKVAMARGTDVHQAAEALNLGVPLPHDFNVANMPYVDRYREFLTDFKPTFVLAEAPVYSLTWRYAGTLDGIIEMDGKNYLMDIKTTDKEPFREDGSENSRHPYPDIALQMVAYARAELVGYGEATRREIRGRRYYVYDSTLQAYEPMPEIHGALALAISPYDYRLVPVSIDDEVWQSFLYVKEVARWNLETSKRVLGPPITKRGDES